MKLCFVAYHSYPLFVSGSDTPFGGTEVQISTLARYFARRPGTEVAVIVGDYGQPDELSADGVTLVKAVRPNPAARLPERLANFARLFGALRRAKADVYVGSAAGPEVGIAALYCRAARRRFVYRTAHQMDCDGEFERNNGWRGRLYGYGLRHADAVVTQTEEHQSILRARGIEATVIRNVFDTERTARGFDRPIDALWVGRCEAWKNPGLFLDLAERLPDLRFRMICPRKAQDQGLFDAVSARAAALPNVDFIEKVPFAEIQRHFDEAKLFVGTSDYEGFPNTYLQACLGGTPIASLKVDPDGFIAAFGAGFAADGDFHALCGFVERAAADPGAWQAASASARDYVRSRHDLQREGAKWADLVAGLARWKAA